MKKARHILTVLFVLSSSSALLRPLAAAEDVSRWLEEFRNADPFLSERAAAEIRKLGPVALDPLVATLEDPDPVHRIRVEELLNQVLGVVFQELDSEYRALDSDRRELGRLRQREKAREEIARLRADRTAWEKQFPDLLEKVEVYIRMRTLEQLVAAATGSNRESPPGGSFESEKSELEVLRKQVAGFEKAVAGFVEKAEAIERLVFLEAREESFKELSDVEVLRRTDLEERVKDREPRVDALLEQLRAVGPAAFCLMKSRLASLPLDEAPAPGQLRSSVEIFYAAVLRQALDELRPERLVPEPDRVDRVRYFYSLLWVLEVDIEGAAAGEAGRLLAAHLEATLEDLAAAAPVIRERAAEELYRLEERGVQALETRIGKRAQAAPGSGDAGNLARYRFLAGLLRWRISPATYEQVGIDFSDYSELPFNARRRKIFQYARAAGLLALPTLRVIVLDDEIETSFLVKYAAAKALATQLGDRLGYLVLQARHPEMVLKRPEISRDLMLIQGLAFIRSKDYAQAIVEFEKILEEFPFDFEGNYHIAFAYLLLGNFARSIHHFEIARRVNPNDQLTLYNLACAYSLGGHPEKALEALDDSVEAGFDDGDHMENDPDLDPIRDRARYREILEKARARAKQK